MNTSLQKRVQLNSINQISISTGVSNGVDCPVHSHEFDELVMILDGNAIQQINDEKFLVSAGDVFVIKGNDIHGFRDTHNLDLFNIGYQSRVFSEHEYFLKEIPGYVPLFYLQPSYRKQSGFESRLHLNTKELMEIKILLNLLKEEYTKRTPGCEVIVRAYFSQLVVLFSRKYSKYDFSFSRCFSPILKAIHYIEKHYTDKITLEELAHEAGLKVNTFLNEFKRTFNASPINYILDLRIRKACELLLMQDQKSITLIANEVGFSDSNYFTRIFKEKVGCTPTHFRKSI